MFVGMHPILLYGFPAGSSLGLVAAFEQAGRPYHLCRVDMLADLKTDRYARLNGRRETPVLITEAGRALTETLAIASWLEARDGQGGAARRISFAPMSEEADRMHQWMAFVNTGFTAAFSLLWAALELRPADPPLQATMRHLGGQAVRKRHEQLEQMLARAEGRYLVGDSLSLADTTLIGVARWAEFHRVIEPAQLPRLAAKRAAIEAHPAVRYALAVEEGAAPRGRGACLGHVPLDEVLARFAE